MKSKNLQVAYEFLIDKRAKFLPDEIKEQTQVLGLNGVPVSRVKCSHASLGRGLRRAEVRGDAYKGYILKRDTRRNAEDTDDLAVYYVAHVPTPNPHF